MALSVLAMLSEASIFARIDPGLTPFSPSVDRAGPSRQLFRRAARDPLSSPLFIRGGFFYAWLISSSVGPGDAQIVLPSS